MDITQARLKNQHLLGSASTNAVEAVRHLGAVQSQDFAAAKWSLGQRVANATDDTIEETFNKGEILRTHVLRPTWHFILPEDIRWMLHLTAPQVKKAMATYDRKLELDDRLYTKTTAIIREALEKADFITRQEIKVLLDDARITTDVQRLAHIVMRAELDGVICSGPRRGKQFTYALLDARAPKTHLLNREEACITLAKRYFLSHGPAQLKDFAWWSGLPLKEATQAVSKLTSELQTYIVEGRTFYGGELTDDPTIEHSAQLLSIFDEYTIAYNDRADLSSGNDIERMIQMGNALTAVVILDGKVVGTWKRKLQKSSVIVDISLFREITGQGKTIIRAAADKYGDFLKLRLEITGI
jgi:hypothetical protein